MREVADASFDEAVLASDTPVLVDFWAPWCRPCRAIAPILDQLEQESAGRMAFARLNVDDNPEVASRYGVLSLPTVMLFDRGEPRATVVGARPRKHFEQALAAWL